MKVRAPSTQAGEVYNHALALNCTLGACVANLPEVERVELLLLICILRASESESEMYHRNTETRKLPSMAGVEY